MLKKKKKVGGTWLAQLVEYITVDPGILSSCPMLGVEPT